MIRHQCMCGVFPIIVYLMMFEGISSFIITVHIEGRFMSYTHADMGLHDCVYT